jgi:hypothetical protein
MMYAFYLVTLFPLLALAEVNGKCSGVATGDYLSDGICEPTATCDYYHGSYINNGCPNDADDVKCCLIGLGNSIDGRITFIPPSSCYVSWAAKHNCGAHERSKLWAKSYKGANTGNCSEPMRRVIFLWLDFQQW